MFGKFILSQRQKHGLSQQFLASKIGVSRPTYLQIERGERELTLSEAQKLADIFGLAFVEFINARDNAPTAKIKKAGKPKQAKATSPAVRISIPQKNLTKFKEVLLYVLSKVGGKPNVGEAVLYKLLYFIDFDFYEKFEEQLVGATYIKNHYGPTPVEFKVVVDDMIKKGELTKIEGKYFSYPQRKYLPVRRPNLMVLSGREIGHIDEVLARLSDKNAKEMENYSHGDMPWQSAESGKALSYESVFYRAEPYSVRNYDDEL